MRVVGVTTITMHYYPEFDAFTGFRSENHTGQKALHENEVAQLKTEAVKPRRLSRFRPAPDQSGPVDDPCGTGLLDCAAAPVPGLAASPPNGQPFPLSSNPRCQACLREPWTSAHGVVAVIPDDAFSSSFDQKTP
jgi:hypothetical protein